jgi:hypothetical protein
MGTRGRLGEKHDGGVGRHSLYSKYKHGASGRQAVYLIVEHSLRECASESRSDSATLIHPWNL